MRAPYDVGAKSTPLITDTDVEQPKKVNSKPPRRAEYPNYQSTASYYHEGRRHIRQAMKLPDYLGVRSVLELSPIELKEMLVEYICENAGLRISTQRKYREDYWRVLFVIARRQEAKWRSQYPDIDLVDWLYQTFDDIDFALHSKTSGSKRPVKIASKFHTQILFQDLSTRFLKSQRFGLAETAIMIVVMREIGIRPIEFLDATLEDDIVTIQSAKRRIDDPIYRRIDISNLAGCYKRAIGFSFEILQADSRHSYKSRHKRLAEILARVCAKYGLPRYSLYSFRHLAVARWIDAGMLDEAISVLLGHVDLRTARKNYARTTNGFYPTTDELPLPVNLPVVPTVDPLTAFARPSSQRTKTFIADEDSNPLKPF